MVVFRGEATHAFIPGTRNMFAWLLFPLSLLCLVYACQPPDCDRPDCGTCGNACCTLEFYFEKQPDDMYDMMVHYLQKGGADDRYKFIGGSDLRQYNVTAQFILQGQHTTLVMHYNDTLNFALYYQDSEHMAGTTVRAFSISDIAGAWCDQGQNYKNLAGYMKGLGEKLTLQGFLDCKANQQCTLQSPFQIQHVLLTEETLTVIGKSSTQQALYKHATDTVNVKISKVVIVCEDLQGENLQEEIKLRSIVSGELHTVAVTDDQEVGEITHINNSLIFRPLPFQTAVNQVCCGKEHVLILTLGGDIYTYGLGSRGQLGHGTTEKELKPRVVEALQGVTMATIAAGGWHSAALSAIGDVYIWGWNESGQLGLPMKQQTNGPERHQCSQENVTDKTVERDYKLSFQQKCYQEGRSFPKRTTDMEIQSVYSEHKNDKCHSCHSVVETSQTELAVPESGPTSVSLKADDGMSSGVSGNSDNSREDVDVIVLCQMFPCLLEFPEEVNVSKVSCGSRHTAAVTALICLHSRIRRFVHMGME
ncbi:uncharacterized protein [Ptychodera flava]|uniref:uncharacterized protein isoform X2 n=1 Tax=Ptychodera flava TaxID=63121 RepID=UPI00396A43BF